MPSMAEEISAAMAIAADEADGYSDEGEMGCEPSLHHACVA